MGGCRPQRSQELEAGHIRQLHIQKHDIRIQCVRRVNGGLAAVRLAHHLQIPAALAKPGQAFSRGGVVIYDQYSHIGSQT